jgi:hypothetical protein
MTTFYENDTDSAYSEVDEDKSHGRKIDEDQTESVNAYNIEAFTKQSTYYTTTNFHIILPTHRHGVNHVFFGAHTK